MKDMTVIAMIIIGILAVAAVFAAIYMTYLATMPTSNKYDNLARCLTERGAVMYGTQTCHACIYQREMLGSSFQYISEVDCVQQYQVCMNQRIGATPTWLINGSFYVGVQTPERLANESGCSI